MKLEKCTADKLINNGGTKTPELHSLWMISSALPLLKPSVGFSPPSSQTVTAPFPWGALSSQRVTGGMYLSKPADEPEPQSDLKGGLSAKTLSKAL